MMKYDSPTNRARQATQEMDTRHSDEQALQIASLVYQNSSEAMAVIDADNRIIAINPAFTQMTGYRLEEIENLGFDGLGIGDSGPALLQVPQNPPNGLGHWSGELWLRRKSGEDYAVRLTLNAILDDKGQIYRRVALLMDVTERKRRDEALETARQQADAASRAKSEFLANMSHEIRTPLNAIIGMTHLLQRCDLGALGREKLKKIEESAQHLLEILNEVLDISKIEAGRFVLEHTEFDLEESLQQVLHWLAGQAASKGLEIVADVESRLPGSYRGDPLRLRQILLNLAGNAVKFTEAGHVLIRVRQIEETNVDCLIRFEVQDTGIGIAAGHLHKLFSTFEQLDSSTTRRFGGTGLGLAIAKSLVSLMGGKIGVESQLGQGSTFWFAVRLSKSGQLPAQTTCPEFFGARALVVDDLAASRKALAGRLGQLGFRVDSVISGADALAAIQAADIAGEAYQWIIIDQDMPGMGGLETAARLSGLPLKSPPAHRLLTVREGQYPTQAVLPGIDALLVKPTLLGALRTTLLGVLSRLVVETQAKPPENLTEAELSKRFGGVRLLLAEDEPINREVALDMLESVGLKVDVASTGAEAVALAKNTHYALILMDLHMPIMGGLEAASAIRALPGRQSLPIVAMTADAFLEDREACLAAGMDDHLAKPVDPDTLYKTLLKWLATSSAQRIGAETVGLPTMPPLPGKQPKPSILCVDDEPGRLAVLRGILQKDYGLYFARNGEQALDAARKTRPSLILLDTQMPGMDGLATCRQLKADPATRDIPVVFVMALSEVVDERACFDAGGGDYLTQPILPLGLLARVALHLSQARLAGK